MLRAEVLEEVGREEEKKEEEGDRMTAAYGETRREGTNKTLPLTRMRKCVGLVGAVKASRIK